MDLEFLVTIGMVVAALGFPALFVGLIMLIVQSIKKKSKKSSLTVIVNKR